MTAPRPLRATVGAAAAVVAASLLVACGSSGGSAAPSGGGDGTTLAATTTAAASAVTTAAVATAVAGSSAAPATAVAATAATASTTPAPGSAGSTVPVAAPPAAATTSCKAVVHLGDSTSVGLVSPSFIADPAKRMGAQYARVGATESHLEISGARSIVETLPGQVNARDTAAALKQAGFDGCWVLALGTTDTANVAVGSNITRMDRIDRMMEVIGDDPVMWVDVKTLVGSGAWSNPEMAKWNATLVEAQAKYPNIKVYNWTQVVQDAWFSSDRIHYTGEGYAERARLIADALAATYPA